MTDQEIAQEAIRRVKAEGHSFRYTETIRELLTNPADFSTKDYYDEEFRHEKLDQIRADVEER